jgi:hypothetical protein
MLDYRFLSMDKEGNGHASCGVVRTTIAILLHETCPAGDFLSPQWFSGLAKAAKNPTLRGFMQCSKQARPTRGLSGRLWQAGPGR